MIKRRTIHCVTMLGVAVLLLSAVVAPAQVAKTEVRAEKIETKLTVKKQMVPQGKVFMNPVIAPVEIDKAQRQAMADQVIGQTRPIVRAELHLVRTVCKTSKDDQLKVAKAAAQALRDVVDKIAGAHLKMQQGIGVQEQASTQSEIQKAIAAVVKSTLTPEQSARYQAEVVARAKAEREIIARVIVGKFDRVLNLSPDQRAKITESIAKSESPMSKSMENLMYNNEYLPAIPDADVVGFLDAKQKTIWQNTQRVTYNSFSWGIAGINVNEADFAAEDDPDSAKEAAKRKVGNGLNMMNGMDGMMMIRAAPVAPPREVAKVPRPAAKPAVK